MADNLADTDQRCTALRAFNRFYTRRIGVLDEGLLHSRFSLTESRLLWELAHRPGSTASALAAELGLDRGYLSRLLRNFRQRSLVTSGKSPDDARSTLLSLSAAGKRALAPLEQRSQQQMAELLAPLAEDQQLQLLDAMTRIQTLLGARPRSGAFVLRAHQAGDIGWVVSRHGALYAQQFGWDGRFEALVAHIAAAFIERFEAGREACWIAERDGAKLGCVFLLRSRGDDDAVEPDTAQLRLLLVEPAARGLGLGAALVAECERFARQAGYRRIRLWTNSVLLAARDIYRKAGYRLLASAPHRSFGQELVGETWELELR
jgi:DNA-binding MarR family transcriptional regulator/N-acetylglutamate synthase-like GNAT family acetyltransferase